MVYLKKYWLAFFASFALVFQIVGPTLNGTSASNFGYAIGFLGIPILVGSVLIKKAKTAKSVLRAHIVHVILLALFGMLAFQDVRGNTLKGIVSECRYQNPAIVNADISESSKNKFCSCFGNLVVTDSIVSAASKTFFYQEITPINENQTLFKKYETAWLTCEANL